MSKDVLSSEQVSLKTDRRSQVLFQAQQNAVYRRTDGLFARLLVFQWLAGIVVALTVSPLEWSGSQSSIHIHVWTAIILGAVIISRPVYLCLRNPGETPTRHTVAIAQMLYSALLIHLSAGRIEFHFHIFGSLAFLSFYRDWKVLISASLVVMLDHIVRGFYFPQSIYGVTAIEPWRWIEHTWWVIFEDVFLIKCCGDNVEEMKSIATRQAEVEETRDGIEEIVKQRTAELSASEQRLATRFAVTKTLSQSTTLQQAIPQIMQVVARDVLPDNGLAAYLMWSVDPSTGKTKKICQHKLLPESDKQPVSLTTSEARHLSDLHLAEKVKSSSDVVHIQSLDPNFSLVDPDSGLEKSLPTAFAFPLMAEGKVVGMIEFFAEKPITMTASEILMLQSLGHQLGDFAEKMRVESENLQLVNMVQWSGDAIIGQTPDGQITSWNQGAEKFFGYGADEIIGQHISKLTPSTKLIELEDLMAENRSGLIVEGVETQRRHKNGRTLDVSVTRSPVFDDQQNIVAIAEVMHNIAERKEAERRVSDFYSIVSHELRTPLTSIRGVLGLIEGGVVEAGSIEAQELMTVARESTDRLIRLINDMLDLKKIEAGKMVLHRTYVPVSKLVSSCLEGLTGMSEDARVKLRQTLRYKGEVFADQDKATQILTNLVSNAIKFSKADQEINVVIEATERSMVRFKVTDSGPGISPNDQLKLFEKFQQLDTSDARQGSGSGLGLAICRALVEEHGGSIGVESFIGMGSTFWFDLPGKDLSKPLDKAADDWPDGIKDIQSQGSGNKKILLVEDDLHLAKMLCAHFDNTGYQTTWAATIKEGRQSIERHLADPRGNNSFAAIVLDLALPDGSGLDLLGEIKSEEKTAMLPVIVITGQTIDDTYIANATVAEWLSKPFNSEALVKVLDRLTHSNEVEAVLVADVDTGARQVVGQQITAMGMHFIEAKNSLEAVALTGEIRPDVIILDVMMPDQNAIEKLKVLRLNEGRKVINRKTEKRKQYVPIVVYSSTDLSEQEKKQLRLGKTNLLHQEKCQETLIEIVCTLLGGICK